MFIDEGVIDPQFFKMNLSDLEVKLDYHQREIISLELAIKSNKKWRNLVLHEVELRKALRGDEIERADDCCGYCKRSIMFEHPHESDNSITQFGVSCPSISITEHIKNLLSVFGSQKTERILIDVGDMIVHQKLTKHDVLLVMENLKDNNVIKFDVKTNTWSLS